MNRQRDTRGIGWRGRQVMLGGLMVASLLVPAPFQARAAQPLSNGYCDSQGAGSYDTCYGSGALYYENGGNDNSAFGYESLLHTTTGTNNTASGYLALYSNTAGNQNVAIGSSALFSNVQGYDNTANGYQALYNNTYAYNTATGAQALYTNTNGYDNVADGALSLFSNSTGYDNTASGVDALYSNGTGFQNAALGFGALYSNTTGSDNTASGYDALYTDSTGGYNTGSGYEALYADTTGTANTASGAAAMNANTTGSSDTATGVSALLLNTGGSSDTADGFKALGFNTTGGNNTALGYQAGVTGNNGNANTTGSNNTFIGYESGPGTSTQLTNATAIGTNAVVSESNALVLGAAGTDVGIGTATPDQALTVAGTIESTSGGFKFPDGTVQTSAATLAVSPGPAGNYLRSDGADWASSAIQTGDLPNLSSQYVDLSSDQLIAGSKTFSSTIQGDISGNAGTVTNGVYTTGNYADPAWLTSLSGSKLTGTVPVSSIPAGSSNYIQNGAAQQAGASFNIDGNGTLGGTLNVATAAAIAPSGGSGTLLQVGTQSTSYGSFLQVPLVTSNSGPPASMCNTGTYVGRLVLQASGTKTSLWSCSSTGKWVVAK